MATTNWFNIRCNFITLIVFIIAALFTLIYRNTGNSVMLSLMLTYILMLSGIIKWFLFNVSNVERKMVNVDRCLKLLDIP